MKGHAIKYSETELRFIKKNSKLPRRELCLLFNAKFERELSKDTLKALCQRRNWPTGRTGRYEKGNIPHPNARMKSPNKTSFKQGHRPHNWMPVYSTRVSKDGYLEIKTEEPGKWEQAHVLLWKAQNGKVPKRSCVSFKDGNKTNLSIDNLEIISRSANLRINKIMHTLDPTDEAKPSVRTLGKLVALIYEKGAHEKSIQNTQHKERCHS